MVEDTGERGYAIDRMLVQLVQAGILRGVRALVFGQFTGGREPDGRFTGTEVVARFAERMRIPVLAGAPFGHGAAARAVPLGVPAKLELGPDGARMTLAWTPGPAGPQHGPARVRRSDYASRNPTSCATRASRGNLGLRFANPTYGGFAFVVDELDWVTPYSSPRSSTRRILPEMVLGRAGRNSISRGYL